MVDLLRRKLMVGAGVAAASMTFSSGRAFSAEPLKVGLPAVYTPFAALEYANRQGYFGGTTVEVTVFRGGSAAQEALAAGAIDVASISPPTAALAVKKGVSQKIIALCGPPTLEGWCLASSAKSGVKDIKGLAGANVGITAKGSTTDFLIAWSAHNASVAMNTIPLGSGVLPALNAGQIGATVLWPLVSFKAITAGEVYELEDYGATAVDATFDSWVASTTAIDGKKEQLKAFLAGIGKVVKELQADQAKTMQILSKYHRENDEKVLKLAHEKLIGTMRSDNVIEIKGIDGALKMAAIAGVSNLPSAAEITDLSLL